MQMLLVNILAILCTFVWTRYGASGGKFQRNEIFDEYKQVTSGIGSILGGLQHSLTAEDVIKLTMALNRIAAMMQMVVGPYGAPEFLDQKSFMETEQIFSRMGPYICLLPESHPKKIEDVAPILGGMVGGLIGQFIGEQQFQHTGFDRLGKTDILSGLGTIAGTLGGMSGYEVLRGPYGMPNASHIIQKLPELVTKMGDMKEMIQGSFTPLTGKKYDNLRLLVESDLRKSLEKMSTFLSRSSNVFYHENNDPKSGDFNTRFQGLDSQLTTYAKSVSAMAGVYGGIIGYILPRQTEYGKVASGKSNFAEIKSSLGKTRSSVTNAQAKSAGLFGALLDQLLGTAAEVGGYGGIIGGMMAEVFSNGAPSQAGKILFHWSSPEKPDETTTLDNKNTDDIQNFVANAIPGKDEDKLKVENDKCFEYVAMGLKQLSFMHKFDDLLPGSLDFRDPYGESADRVDAETLQRKLIGSRWSGKWKNPFNTLSLQNGRTFSDFSTVIDEKSLNEDAVIDFINQQVTDSNTLKFFQGKLTYNDLSSDERKGISIDVLSVLKESTINGISSDKVADILSFDSAHLNPERLKIFVNSLSDEKMNGVLEVVKSRQSNNTWKISRDAARIVSLDLIRRYGLEVYTSNLCPFVIGLTSEALSLPSADHLFMSTNVIDCMNTIQENISYAQRDALIRKSMEFPSITLQRVRSLKSFSADARDIIWQSLAPNEIETLVNEGFFSQMKKLPKKNQKKLMDALENKLSISSSNSSSTSLLNQMGSVICGMSVNRMDSLVPANDLENFKSNWTTKCLIERFAENIKHKKECASKKGLGRNGYCKPYAGGPPTKRFDTIKSFDDTRNEVANGLSNLTGTLSLLLSVDLNGLRLSEITAIPNSVLSNSIDKTSDNERLSKWQKSEMLRKVLADGHAVDTKLGLEKLGDLVSAIDVDSVDASHLDELLKEKPHLLQQLSKAQKVTLYTKLLTSVQVADLLVSKTKLSTYVSINDIQSTSELNFEIMSKMRWTRAQGIVLLEKYREAQKRSILQLNDVRTLGSISIGLTCHDVSTFKFHSIIDISRSIDEAIGNGISADLANCLATKINLCLKMKCYKGSTDINEIVGKEIPGNILLFMPPDVLATVSYSQHCFSMIRRLGQANIDLIPAGVGHLTINGIIQTSHVCFNSKKGEKPPVKLSENTEPSTNTANANIGNNIDSLKDLASSSGIKVRRSVEENQKPNVTVMEVEALGVFACFLKNYSTTVNGEAMAKVSEMLPKCIHRIDEDTNKDLQNMFKNNLDEFVEFYEPLISSLGSLFLIAEPSFISTMSTELVVQILESVPSKIKNEKVYKDGKSAQSFSFKNNLMLEFPDESKSYTVSYQAINYRTFADAAFPKLIAQISSESENSLFEVVLRAGPAIVGISVAKINVMSDALIKDALPHFGQYSGWNNEQLQAIKTKLTSAFGQFSTWTSNVVQKLGNLATMLTVDEIGELGGIDIYSIEALSYVSWSSDSFRSTLFNRYGTVENKNVGQLTGADLVALGDLMCGIAAGDITSLDNSAIQFAVEFIGKVKCFSEDQRSNFKSKVLIALNENANKPAILSIVGVLAGAYQPNDLSSIKPQDVAFMSSHALDVLPAASIKNMWNESHYSQIGTINGDMILLRSDVFKDLNSKLRNAVFRSAFGNNAGMVTSQIRLLKKGINSFQNTYSSNMKKLQESIKMLYEKINSDETTNNKFGFGSVFNLGNPESFIKPPPPDFAVGLDKDDFSRTFETSFLEDTKVINFINSAATSNINLLGVLKGEGSINDLGANDIFEMPSKVFSGLKASQIQEMSADSISSLLNSPLAARDPISMSQVFVKMDETNFDLAITKMNEKMMESIDSLVPWRPPLTTQEIVIKDFMKKLKSNELSNTEVLSKFVESMCPFVAGMPPGSIRKLPFLEDKKREVLKCMSQSYRDLSTRQKKQVVTWAIQNVKKTEIVKIDDLEMFMLDLPPTKASKALTSEMTLLIVENGNFSNLDHVHSKYHQFSKKVIPVLIKNHKEKFDNVEFLNKLSYAQCEIPLKKIKSSISKSSISHIADFTMTKCRSQSEYLEENLEQCDKDVSQRLQRCSLFQEEVNDLSSGFSFGFAGFSFDVFKPKRASLDTFQMMTELAEGLLKNSNLGSLDGNALKENAGALGGLNPVEMQKLSGDSILTALSTIKDNVNLSPKQKKIMFEKAKGAGFSLDTPTSLAELGELIDEVPPEDFKNMLPENLKSSLASLKEKADMFSPSQRKAIVAQLQESGDLNELLNSDLGSLASEIPLFDLTEIDSFNVSDMDDQDWVQSQAIKLIQVYRNFTDDAEMNVDFVSDLGSIAIGLKCSDIMDLEYYDVSESITSIYSSTDLKPDMDECVQAKLHFTNQVENGVDYLNNTNITNLEEILGHIPDDVAMYFPAETLELVPDSLCSILFEKVGQANLNSLPAGPGSIKRQKLANCSLDCLKRSSGTEFTAIEENDVLFLGNLICDITANYYTLMTEEAFVTSLTFMSNCFHRFTEDHVSEFQKLVNTYMGSSSDWDDSILSALGPLVGLLSSETIQSVDNEYFADAYDDIIPPELDSSVEISSLVNRDSFYEKSIEALVESNQPVGRRKRQDETPTYVDIALLGQGNTKWTTAQLERITDEDLNSSLDILGAVEGWSTDQKQVLLKRYQEALTRTVDKWTSSEIKDAKYILTDLSASEIEQLDISTLQTTGSLSDLPWTLVKRTAAVENYLTRTSKTAATISAEDIAGLGNLLCGLGHTKMAEIPVDTIKNSIKNLGQITCYDQNQLDALFELVKTVNDNNNPSGALINEMGSLVAGMSEDAFKEISTDDMSLITLGAISIMPGARFSNSMSNDQLAAAGSTNIAAIIDQKSLFNALTTEQRNTLYNAAYGTDAPPITDDADATISPKSEDTQATNSDGKAGTIHLQICPVAFLLYCFMFLFW